MVHSSLGKVGWTVGGPVTVIRALLDVLGTAGTLVMPAESPGVSDPSTWNDDRVKVEWHDTIRTHLPVFDPLTTPTTLGAIPEAFRTFPGTLRSNHPLVSVCANGPIMENDERLWVERPDMAFDNGVHFAVVGGQFAEKSGIRTGRIGDADSMLFPTRDLVNFAESYFLTVL